MRACQPARDGYVERDEVKVFYEVFGAGEPTVLLLPTWSIVHSRLWKLQVPDLARRHRVVVLDGRGNGRSDRPTGAEAYRPAEFTADALAVMDATGTERAVLVAVSLGATWALELGALHPERVAGIVFIGLALPLVPLPPEQTTYSFDDVLDTDEGWARYNQHYWREHYRDFLEFFMSQIFTEPHSTKEGDRGRGGLGAGDRPGHADRHRTGRPPRGPGVGPRRGRRAGRPAALPGAGSPRQEDAICPLDTGVRLAELAAGTLVTIEGAGHATYARDPVRFNLLLREFIGSLEPRHPNTRGRTWTRALRRPRRALYLSSRSASVTPAATWPSPTSCGHWSPAWRSTGWPRTR
jgi:pimeloyl-ACP methyl ester carboxylesterase